MNNDPDIPRDYPAGTVRALLETSLLTPPTRAVLEERLQQAAAEPPRFFSDSEMATLCAVHARFIPQEWRETPLNVAADVDIRLADGKGDGWRYDALPPDGIGYRRALAGLDETATARFHAAFSALAGEKQDDVLRAVQSGEAEGETWKSLPPKRVFEELLAEFSERYFSDPLTLERIGYAGMADAHGWAAIGLNQLEAWEPRGERPTPGSLRFATPSPGGRGFSSPYVSRLPVASESAGGLFPENPLSPGEGVASLSEPGVGLADTLDAVIIGTGAGGAPLLARMAAAGLRVVALEAGPQWDPPRDFATDERSQSKLFWNDERLSAGDDPLAFGNNNSGTGVGGSTLHYTAYVPRPQPDDFRIHSDFGVGLDWPLGYDDFAPYYDEIERVLGVSGPADYPWGPRRAAYPNAPLPLNGAAQLMERACKTLGIRTSEAPNAALSKAYHMEGVGWRPACTNRGFCQAGCSVRAKGSMDVTFIPMAVACGAEVRPNCFVTRIETDGAGRVTGVVYTREGREERQKCHTLFLCGGAIETPRLLLMNGLANGNRQVGRNFMAHTGIQLWGQFEEDVRPYKGIPGGLISEDTHRPKDADFAGGYLLQSIGVMPVTYASQMARGRGLWGPDLDRHMRGYNHVAGINILGDCLPHPGNFVELSEENDARGLPKPRIHFTAGENEKRMTAHAERTMRAIWSAAGAFDVWAFPRYAHIIGTCRMGESAETSVVDKDGRVHGIPNLYISDNSTFPSALSANPALTIMALALRTADRFLEKAKRGET